ncbi:immunoglobulin-like domain-containing protein [Peribacillus kribbensis]|uniref:immunoglobulin-like domain-containing protein n=1 Tax=Peribacillus kribbensis TaxID=356658 RepID=UPI00047D4BF2|nr:immunoglobulin-like domain-containing protein [Peribacillus kribbensis]
MIKKLGLVLICVLMLFLLAACSSEERAAWTKKDSGYQDLPSSIGMLPAEQHSPVKAKIYTDKASYDPKGKVIVNLKNIGSAPLFFGADYPIEKYENGSWETLVFEDIQPVSIGRVLPPEDTHQTEISLPSLPKGTYRIVKTMNAGGASYSITLGAEFKVT